MRWYRASAAATAACATRGRLRQPRSGSRRRSRSTAPSASRRNVLTVSASRGSHPSSAASTSASAAVPRSLADLDQDVASSSQGQVPDSSRKRLPAWSAATARSARLTPSRTRRSSSGALPAGDPEGLCQGRIARHTLLQFSFFGLLEERCLTEKLFEAQFGLRFHDDKGARVRADEGKGAHRVAKLRYASLTAPQQARVAALNRNDLLVYEEARQVFFARLSAFGIPLDACAS